MKSLWIIITVMSLLIIGCGPSAHVRHLYHQVGQVKTGEIVVFNSLDEIAGPYIKVAELEAIDQRTPNQRDRGQMLESLKAKARKVGADGIVLVEEGTSVINYENPFGGSGTIDQECNFIKSIAIIRE